MQIVLIILIVALVAKDTSYLGDPYIMRGFAQGLCLIVGGMWLVTNISGLILKRYWPVFGYLAIILVATMETRDPVYVLWQVASLAAVIFFFIAYFETERKKGYPHAVLVNTTLIAFSLVAMLSLVLAKYLPSLAYVTLYGGELRFRGLYGSPGMLASTAGVLIGFAWFSIKRKWLKLILILVAAVCLEMTLSRTFWVALALAGTATAWRYRWMARKWIVSVAVAILLLASFLIVFGIHLDTQSADRIVRSDSITNLTGRVSLWEAALKAFYQRPFIGYGFTTGSNGLEAVEGRIFESGASSIESARSAGRETMHSGYIQSLLDSGLIGTILYISVMGMALSSIMKYGKEKRFAPYFFALLFLMIANIAENVIYSASVFSSILFWGVAIFAISLKGSKQIRVEKT